MYLKLRLKIQLISFYSAMLAAGLYIAFFAYHSAALALEKKNDNSPLKIGVVLEPPHLDPTAGAAAAIDEIVYGNIFEGLTRIDQTGAVKPALARSWDISDDGLEFTFHLHENVTFHDGKPFTADDVVFSLKRVLAPDSVNAQKGLFDGIKDVIAADPHRVIITLTRPKGDLLFNLGWGDAVIVNSQTVETNKITPIGTGAYRFVRWVKGASVRLVVNPDYWGKPAAIPQVDFMFIKDPNAAYSALKAGDIDISPNFQAVELVDQFMDDPDFTVAQGTTEGETILTLNNAQSPLDQRIFRQALSHAIDKQSLSLAATEGYGTLIGSHFAPHHPAYVDLANFYDYNPDKARQLLKDAGVDLPLTLTIAVPPPAYARRSSEIIAAQLAQIGISLEIEPMEWSTWLQQIFKDKTYDLSIISHTEPMDIGIYARDDYYFNYDNAEFKSLYDQIKTTNNDDKRNQLLGDAQRMIARDAVNVFLFQLPKIGIWNAQLKGMWHNAPIQANILYDAYWE